MAIFKVSQSKINLYRRCKRAYHEKYVENRRKIVKSRPLQFGTIIHHLLDCIAEGEELDPVLNQLSKKHGKKFYAEREIYGDIINDVRYIMTDYEEYWEDRPLYFDRINGKRAEHKFEMIIAPGICLTGKIDGIARTPNKLRWMVEHKTFTNMPSDDHRWRNIQSSVYLKVIKSLGWKPVEGTLWNYIRSKSPATPRILKSGKPSKKMGSTLPSKVMDVLKTHKGVSKQDRTLLLKAARESMPDYFKRVFTPVKLNVVDILFEELVYTAQEMKKLHGIAKERSIDRHCEWCDYESLCRAELQSSDVEYVKEKEYTQNVKDTEIDFENLSED